MTGLNRTNQFLIGYLEEMKSIIKYLLKHINKLSRKNFMKCETKNPTLRKCFPADELGTLTSHPEALLFIKRKESFIVNDKKCCVEFSLGRC